MASLMTPYPVDSDGTRIMMIICYYAGDAGPHGHWHSAMLLCLELGRLATKPKRGPLLDLIRRLTSSAATDARLDVDLGLLIRVSTRKN